MRRARPEPHALAGAYALDALTGTEKVHCERHVARCRQCAGELSELRDAVARLAAAAACEPPPRLTERALAVAAHTRQLRPATAGDAAPLWPGRVRPRLRQSVPVPATAGDAARDEAGPWSAHTRRRAGAWARTWVGARGGTEDSPSRTPVPLRRSVRARRRALTVTVAVVAVAVISGAITFVAAHKLSEQQQLSEQQRSHAIAVVLTAPDATMMSAPIATGGTATIVMSHRHHELVFAASGLAALPPSSCYELWLMGPGGDRPAGMLPAPRHGMTGPVTAAGLAAGDHLGLTIEPAGGGRRPGSKMILVVAL